MLKLRPETDCSALSQPTGAGQLRPMLPGPSLPWSPGVANSCSAHDVITVSAAGPRKVIFGYIGLILIRKR